MKKRVVITGLGVIAPNGTGKQEFWENIIHGRSFIKSIERFDASQYPSRLAGEIKGFRPEDFMPLRLAKKIDRFTQYALVASDLAIRDANLALDAEDSGKIGIIIGNCLGGWEFAETELRNLYTQGVAGVSPFQATAWFPPAPQGQISIYYKIKGYAKTVVADRASGNVAIGYAARLIEEGSADVVLAGGSEAPVSPYALLCCNTGNLLSTRNENPAAAYQPFDQNRCGMVIGEGAGILIVEELEHALRRGARIYAEVKGFGWTSDGYHTTEFAPDGLQYARAIKTALQQGDTTPEAVDYICADGLGSRVGDAIETRVIKHVFQEHAAKLAVSAPKSMFGNLLGASGVIDAIIGIMAMNDGIVPPTVHYETPDPECDLNYVPNQSIQRNLDCVMVLSRGQGGVNAALLLNKFKKE